MFDHITEMVYPLKYVVLWKVQEGTEEVLVNTFGPFKNFMQAINWCNKVKDDSKYHAAMLCVCELTAPNTIVD